MRNQNLLALCAAVVVIASSSPAADQTWITGMLDKTWSNTTPNWTPPGATGGWDNGNNALFGTVGETLTIGTPMTIGNLTFTAPTYIIGAVAGPNALTFVGPSALIDCSAAGTTSNTTTINANLVGTLPNGLMIKAIGDFAATPGQGLRLAGLNTFTGDISVTSGVLSYTANTALGNAANKIFLDGGCLLDTNLNVAIPRPINVGPNGGWIRLYGNVTGAGAFSGPLSGAGTLTHTDGGVMTLSGDMSAFTGTVDQVGAGATGIAGLVPGTAVTGVLPATNGNWITSAGTLSFDHGRFGAASTITMNGGTLQWRGNGITSPFHPIDDLAGRIKMVIGKTATFDTGTLNTITIGGSFSGDASTVTLTKVGTGTLIFPGDISVGGVNVNAGTLSVPGTLAANGTISVNNTGTLHVSGGLNPLSFVSVNSGGTLACDLSVGKTLGTVTMATGGTISPGARAGAGYLGILRAEGLTINGGTLNADIGTNSNDLSIITGSANFLGATVVNIRLFGSPLAGQRTLLMAGLVTGTNPTVTVTPPSTRYTLTPGGSATEFFVTVGGGAKDLLWSAPGGTGTWDVNSTANWNAGADLFMNLDNVTFGALAADATVTAPLNLTPNNMTISNDTNRYSFATGVINGSGTLTKNGTGSAVVLGGTTFQNAVINNGVLIFDSGFDQRDGLDFFGTATVNAGGTLQLGNLRTGSSTGVNNFNIGTQFVINGGTVDVWERTDIGKITMTGGSILGSAGIAGPGRLWIRGAGLQTLPAAATATIANGEWALADNSTFDIAKGTSPNGIDLALSAIITSPGNNFGIRKNGAGTMTISSACTFTAGTTINGGALNLIGGGATSNVASNKIAINANSTLALGRNEPWGGHTTTVNFPIAINPGGTMTNLGNFYSTLGAITLTGGTLTGIGGANANLPTWGLKGPVTVNANSAVSTISATGNLGAVTLGQAAVTGTTFTVADGKPDVDLLVSAIIWDGRNTANNAFQPSSLTKAGPGAMALTAANIYTGPTSVTGGKLIVDGSLNAASAVSLSGGTQLRGTGTIGGTVTTSAGALIIPGNTIGTTAAKGILTIGGLNTAAGGIVNVRVSSPLLVQGDLLNVNGTANLDLSAATLAVQAQSGSYAGQTIVVLQTTGGDYITKPFGTVPTDPAITVAYLNAANAVVTPDGVTPATFAAKVRLTLNAGVTPATVASFSARAEGAGALVAWNCVSEFQNVGFNLYRRANGHEEWTRVNPSLIAGRVTNPAPKSYSVYDWALPGMYEYKLESISLSGVSEEYASLSGPICIGAGVLTSEGLLAANSSVELAAQLSHATELSRKFNALAGSVNATGATIVQSTEGSLLLPARVQTMTGATGEHSGQSDVTPNAELTAKRNSGHLSTAESFAVAARLFSSATLGGARGTTAAKVEYNSPGVLVIRQSMLPAGFDVRRVSIQREGRNLTALALTPDAAVLYAPGYSDEYTDRDALFLRRTNGPTAAGSIARAHGLFESTQAVNVDTPSTASAEFHDIYFDYNLRPYNYAPWFSAKYLTSGTSQAFTLDTTFASGGAAALTVNVWSLTQSASGGADHALQVVVNGQPAGQALWSGGGKMMQLTFQLASGALNNGTNQIELVTPALDGISSQIAFLHSMSIAYTRTLDGSAPVKIENASSRTKLFELSGVPGADAWVVDARYPERAALLPYESQAQAGGTYKLRFNAPAGGTGEFLVVPAGQENAPIAVSKRLLKPVKATPYMAVGPSQFAAGVQPLLALRSKEGLRAAFTDQQQIFDYYNYGRYGPAGIQKAVRAARPQYLLLLGRTTYDYRNYSGNNVDPLCPAFLVTTNFWAQATSDSLFGDLGRGYPEVAVGRLPVNDAAELRTAVGRITGYRGASASGVRLHAVADRADPTVGDFSAQAESIRQSNPELSWQQNYLGVTSEASANTTAAMTEAANGGADWILYVGHGNAAHLGKDSPNILDAESVRTWTGNGVLLQATCTANWMAKDEQGYRSIAIQALTQPQGGISASIASSTYMNSDAATEFMNQLLKHAGAGTGSERWGAALLKAQQWAANQSGSQLSSAFYRDLMTTEQIFGDPALPIHAQGKTSVGTSAAPGAF